MRWLLLCRVWEGFVVGFFADNMWGFLIIEKLGFLIFGDVSRVIGAGVLMDYRWCE